MEEVKSINKKINKNLFKIKKWQIDWRVIFTKDQLHDPKYTWKNGDWVKKSYYDKELWKDFHWMEKTWWTWSSKIGTREQIKVKVY